MSNATTHSLLRWLRIVLGIPIVGYIYSPFEEIPKYASAVRFVFLPVMVLSGLWMWKGDVLRRLISKARPDKALHPSGGSGGFSRSCVLVKFGGRSTMHKSVFLLAGFLLLAAVSAEVILTLTALAAASQLPQSKGVSIMANTSHQQTSQPTALQQTAKPHPDLKSLERLIGKWKVTGDAQGAISYEWMEGGFFMLQRFDILHARRGNKGIEIIGHLHPLFGEPSKDIRTRVYSQLDGLTLDYVYELEGDTLTIWGGEKGSPAYFKGTFGKDGNTLTGSWVYPGGGYSTTSTRVK